MECHNVLPHEKSLVDLPLLRFAFSPVEFFITHSTKDRDDLYQIVTPEKTGIAPLPEVSEFAGAETGDRSGRTILFFGIIRKYKGLDVLMEAMAKVLTQIDCNLVVAGEFYEPVEHYNELARRLGIESRLRIEDRYIPNEDVPALISEADVLVLPYLSATQSGVARIALANNLPIIAARTGGLMEVVREGVNGLLFEPGDKDALADSIVRYFTRGMGPRFAANIKNSRGEMAGSELADLIEEMAEYQV
jgi:glycosyltransferase involved in cell wall biosynthesis